MYALALPVLVSVMALVVGMLLPALIVPKFIADGFREIVHVFDTAENVMVVVFPAPKCPVEGLGT